MDTERGFISMCLTKTARQNDEKQEFFKPLARITIKKV